MPPKTYEWKSQDGDLGNSAKLTAQAANILSGMTDGWSDALEREYNRKENIQNKNRDSAIQANTAALIDAIRQGKKVDIQGPYDALMVANARWDKKKYDDAMALKRAAQARTQSGHLQDIEDANALGSFYAGFPSEYDDATQQQPEPQTQQSRQEDTNTYGYNTRAVIDSIIGSTRPSLPVQNDTLTRETDQQEKQSADQGGSGDLLTKALQAAQDNPISIADSPYRTTASNTITPSPIDLTPKHSTKETFKQIPQEGPVKTEIIEEQSIYTPKGEYGSDLIDDSKSMAQNNNESNRKEEPKDNSNEITISTIEVDGAPIQVSETRRQRIDNQLEVKRKMKAIEKAAYDKTRAFAKKHPRLAKKAMKGFKEWRKDFRTDFKAENEMTAEAKAAINEQIERERAAYWNSMGYDKNGKPFYAPKEDTNKISTKLKAFTYTDPSTGQQATEYRAVDETTGRIVDPVTGELTNEMDLGSKEPTLKQADAKALDTLGSMNTSFNGMNDFSVNNEGIFGPIASWFDRDKAGFSTSGMGQLLGTDDSKAASEYDGMQAQLKQTVIKSMGANPSDRDLKAIETMLPNRTDEPDVALRKLKRFKEWTYEKQAGTINRLLASNPSAVKPYIMTDGKVRKGLIPGYELVDDNGVLKYIKKK